jgi:hypothetical protein
MSHYCKLKAMKEFNKGTKPVFFHFTSDRYIKMLLNGILDGKKILFAILTPTVFLSLSGIERIRLNS